MQSEYRLASVLKSVNETEFSGTEKYPDKNYGAFYANLEKAVPGEITGRVPGEVGRIIDDGMSRLFDEIYTEEKYNVNYELEDIDVFAIDAWDVLTRPEPKYTEIKTPVPTYP